MMAFVRAHGFVTGIALFVLAAGWLFVRPEPRLQNELDLSPVPMELGNYRGEEVEMEGVPIEDQLAAQAVLYRDYYYGSRSYPVGLVLVYNYARRATSFHDPHVCFPAQGYRLEDKGTLPLEIAGHSVRANILSAEKNAVTWLVLYWYLSDKTPLDVSGRREGDFWTMLRTRVQRKLGVSTMVRIASPISTSEQETIADMQAFLDLFYPRILQVRAKIAQPPMPAARLWTSGVTGQLAVVAMLFCPLALAAASLATWRRAA